LQRHFEKRSLYSVKKQNTWKTLSLVGRWDVLTRCVPYELSGTPSSTYNYYMRHDYRDVSMQGHCVSGTIHFGNQGYQNIHKWTHCLRTSHHPTFSFCPLSFWWWGDGTSRNDMSPYECSGTPGPQINCPWWHNVPALIHPCHYASTNTYRLMQKDRDVSMQGFSVSGTIHLGDQGFQNIRTGANRFGTSRHPTPLIPFREMHKLQKQMYKNT